MPGRRRFLLMSLAMVLFVAGTVAAAIAYIRMSGIAISIHGYIALGLGITFTLLLGIGLMALVFYSARHGYDDIEDRNGE